MFEKEAKEYMHKDGTESEKLLNTIDLSLTKRQAFVLINICKQCFKDGAEFGYSKAKEEIRKELLELRADSFDAGMFLRVGETLRNLGIKEE